MCKTNRGQARIHLAACSAAGAALTAEQPGNVGGGLTGGGESRHPTTCSACLLSKQILRLIGELRNVRPGPDASAPPPPAEDAYQAERIRRCLVRGLPVHLVLPAFPAKSPNPDKTLGPLPDYGEVLALRRLDDLCRRIAQLYAPGAYLTICSDGRVFSDLVRVSEAAVDAYGRAVHQIIAEQHCERLRTYSLDDVFADRPPYEEMRRRLVQEHGEPLPQLRDRVQRDPGALGLLNGIHRFLFEDYLTLDGGSRTQVRNATRELAYAVVQRSNAWSGLVERQFPDAIRLSIHPQPPASRKIGVRLLPSNDHWRSPWHAVPLRDDQGWSLVTRKAAEQMGARLEPSAKYPYYVAAVASHKELSCNLQAA